MPLTMILFLLILPRYQAKSVKFQPSDPKIVNIADKVDFHCSHNDSSLNVMLWYQQTETGMMNLIGYNYVGSEAVYEKPFESSFKMTRTNTQTGGLSINSVTASDSAVYFCAGSTQ
ncbi:hypothetical protein CHARACLAT_017270 [Characodon lateralis]|uniref:Ig-like domain-containing protein n=1 Tax=Characodon lateralis TaxID=208331 RepID=A0ABU7E1U1_9TELE|nr:hypothetical protein [Characodon lateralis]